MIKLTLSQNDVVIRLNPEHIVSYRTAMKFNVKDTVTELQVSTGVLYDVKESPEAIDKLIDKHTQDVAFEQGYYEYIGKFNATDRRE